MSLHSTLPRSIALASLLAIAPVLAFAGTHDDARNRPLTTGTMSFECPDMPGTFPEIGGNWSLTVDGVAHASEPAYSEGHPHPDPLKSERPHTVHLLGKTHEITIEIYPFPGDRCVAPGSYLIGSTPGPGVAIVTYKEKSQSGSTTYDGHDGFVMFVFSGDDGRRRKMDGIFGFLATHSELGTKTIADGAFSANNGELFQ